MIKASNDSHHDLNVIRTKIADMFTFPTAERLSPSRLSFIALDKDARCAKLFDDYAKSISGS